MSIFYNPIVSQSLNQTGTAAFEIINPDATALTDFAQGRDLVVPCFDGIIFSGCVINVDKVNLNQYTATAIYKLRVTCAQDFYKLRNVKTETTGQKTTDSSGDIVKAILPTIWEGDIDLTGENFIYTVGDVDCNTILQEIIDQTQYNWRTRRDYARFATNSVISGTPNTFTVAGDVADSDYNDKLAVFVDGDGAYISTGEITSNTYSSPNTTFTLKTDPAPVSPDEVASGDMFIIPLNPLFDYDKGFTNVSPVRAFYRNTTIFGFDDVDSMNSDYTKVIVQGRDLNDGKITSSLPALWNDDCDTWDQCTYTVARGDGILYQDISFSGTAVQKTIYIRGHNFNPTTSDMFVISIDPTSHYFNYDYVSHSETYTDSGYPVTSVVCTPNGASDINKTFYAGTPVLHSRILVGDHAEFLSSDDAYIGDERISINSLTTVTIGAVTYDCLNVGSTGRGNNNILYAHPEGVLVRNADTIGRGGGIVSETNPQIGSPVDHYGLLSNTVSVSGNCYRGDLDKYATNYILGKSKFKDQGKGWCVLKDFYKADSDHTATGAVPITVGDTIRVWSGTGSSDYNDYQLISYEANMTSKRVEMTLGRYNPDYLGALSTLQNSLSRNIT